MSHGLKRFVLVEVVLQHGDRLEAAADHRLGALVLAPCAPRPRRRSGPRSRSGSRSSRARVIGSPAITATLRPTLKPCGPSGKPVPMTTSSISAGSSFGTFFSTVLDAVRGHVVRPGQVERAAERLGEAGPGRGDDDCFTHLAHGTLLSSDRSGNQVRLARRSRDETTGRRTTSGSVKPHHREPRRRAPSEFRNRDCEGCPQLFRAPSLIQASMAAMSFAGMG